MSRKIYKSKKVIVHESLPVSRTICVHDKTYFLKFPYLIFILRNDKPYKYFHVFASDKPLGEYLYSLPLPNIQSFRNVFTSFGIPRSYTFHGNVCLGLDFEISNITECINKFWETSFNPYSFESLWTLSFVKEWTKGSSLEMRERVSLETLFHAWKLNGDYQKLLKRL